jgi:carnosine synthase
MLFTLMLPPLMLLLLLLLPLQMAEYSINAKTTGILRNTAFLDKWVNHPDVLYARALVEAGSKVVCVADGLPTWVCELMVIKPTVQEAIDFINSIEADLDIPIDPLQK